MDEDHQQQFTDVAKATNKNQKIIKVILGKNKFLMSSDLFNFVLVHYG